MIKRIAAYVFVYLASLGFLTHAFIPHHHHRNILCTESSHCNNNNGVHDVNAPADNHQHDGNGTINCLFEQAIIVPLKEGRNNNGESCSPHHSHFLQVALHTAGNEALHPVSDIAAFIPDVPFSFTSCIAASAGLRAPPLA